MKSSSFIALSAGLVIVVGIGVYWSPKAPSDPTPPAQPASDDAFTRHPDAAILEGDSFQDRTDMIAQTRTEPARVGLETSGSADTTSPIPAVDAPVSTPLDQAIATLISPQASLQEKQQVWKQLHETGQLDRAIEALEYGAAENPTSAEYPATLGQAQLQKAGVLAHHGGTISEMGLLAMQADQNFDAALQHDPANWEAQFFKATAMFHWPLELNKGEEVIQRLSSLADQQDAMVPQPQFAQTYVVLGDQYQKLGQPDHAAATWLIGAQLFPGDPDLQRRIQGN